MGGDGGVGDARGVVGGVEELNGLEGYCKRKLLSRDSV